MRGGKQKGQKGQKRDLLPFLPFLLLPRIHSKEAQNGIYIPTSGVSRRFSAPNHASAKMIGVDLNVMLPLFRDVFVAVDRLDRAGRLAGATINAFIRMDKKLLGGFEISLILARVDAIHGADVNTGRVLRADAGFANYVNSHDAFLLPKSSYGIN
jgi:hypothetical protein